MEQRVVRRQNDGILLPSLKVGAGSGAAGLLFGGIVGTIRSAHPVLWATVTGIQWTLLGGTYWGIRSAVIQTRKDEDLTPDNMAYISAGAGGLTAALIGGVTRGRANILPGSVMGTLIGYLGQKGFTTLDQRHTDSLTTSASESPQEPFWQRAMQSKYSPVKHLSHAEYKKVLEDKLLRVDAEIAVLEDDIAALKTGKERLSAGAEVRGADGK